MVNFTKKYHTQPIITLKISSQANVKRDLSVIITLFSVITYHRANTVDLSMNKNDAVKLDGFDAVPKNGDINKNDYASLMHRLSTGDIVVGAALREQMMEQEKSNEMSKDN